MAAEKFIEDRRPKERALTPTWRDEDLALVEDGSRVFEVEKKNFIIQEIILLVLKHLQVPPIFSLKKSTKEESRIEEISDDENSNELDGRYETSTIICQDDIGNINLFSGIQVSRTKFGKSLNWPSRER